jgi:YD repeat-containing protein
MLINKKHVKMFALEMARGRTHKFTRVDGDFLIKCEANLKEFVRCHVHRLPSKGKTEWFVGPSRNQMVIPTTPIYRKTKTGANMLIGSFDNRNPGNKVVNYGFDVLNRMTALTNWLNGVISYGYDSRGNLLAATNANGTTVSYGYDVADRLVGLTNVTSDASVIATYALTLDAVGNHRQATHNQPLFPILPSQTNNYTYDSDNRLATIDGQNVAHNGNGDLTRIGTSSYTYDFEDRLVHSSLTNGSSTFNYDGLGNRLARTMNGQAGHFVLDRMGALTQVLVEADTNNSPVAYYVYGFGLAERIASSAIVATYHYNIQGSTVALTDSAGKVTDSYAYDSFGVLANSDGDSPQPFRYLGRYGILDDSTGLLYARAR